MANEFENLELKDENTGEIESFTPVDVTAREQIESLNETLTEQDIFGYGTSIEANSDLNDFTTFGKYYVPASAGGTLTNAPTTGRASLYVLGQANNCILQIWTSNTNNEKIFYARQGYTSSGQWLFYNWFRIDMTEISS